jgi:hypothetical protein
VKVAVKWKLRDRRLRRIVAPVAEAHGRWATHRDMALDMLRQSASGFGLAGMKLVTGIFLDELAWGTAEATNRMVRSSLPGSRSREQARLALHDAIDLHFAGQQSPLLASDPVIQKALLRAHVDVDLRAQLHPAPGEIGALVRWARGLKSLIA